VHTPLGKPKRVYIIEITDNNNAWTQIKRQISDIIEEIIF